MSQPVDARPWMTSRHHACPTPYRFGAIAIVAVASLVLLAAIAVAGSGGDTRLRDDGRTATVSAEVAVRARTTVPPRVPPRFVLATFLVLVVVALSRPRHWGAAITTRLRRPIDGVGDDWRALLLGAPPVQA